MQSGYVIEAYSPSLHETHRWFDLSNLTPPTDAIYAQQLADAFAGTFNREQKNYATDWVGKITWQDLGIETISGYIAPQ